MSADPDHHGTPAGSPPGPDRLQAETVPRRLRMHGHRSLRTGIVHLGLGGFHRGHQAVYTAASTAAGDDRWGILGCANRSGEIVRALREQDMLYTVVTRSARETAFSVPAVHTGALVATEQAADVVAAIADPQVRIVTLTVTENGYTYSPATFDLDVGHELVRADLAGGAPRTPLGMIVRGLQRRAGTHGMPITILSCDNLAANGTRTGQLVRQFVDATREPGSDDVQSWIDAHVTFPNSMVDRIVPATTDRERQAVRDAFALRDDIPVPVEAFTMWVMEDRFAGGRPEWERGGAIFSADVEKYETVKLRLLNGTHSLVAYLGALSGRETIDRAIAQPAIRHAAERVLIGEYLPTVDAPPGVDLGSYIESVFTRMADASLRHRTSQVCTNGSVKLPQRVTEPVLAHTAQGRPPGFLALTVAAYLCAVGVPSDHVVTPQTEAIVDPAADRLRRLARAHPVPSAYVRSVFDEGRVFAERLAGCDDFVGRVAELVAVLLDRGVEAAVAEAGA